MTEKNRAAPREDGPLQNFRPENSGSKNTSAKQLEFHPLVDIFPLMGGEDFDRLVADIETNKLRERIVLYEGMILDGRNRYLALRSLGADPETIRNSYCVSPCCIDEQHGGPAAYVASANIHRRHLTAEGKRKAIADLIKAQPEKSDRAIADQVKADKNVVSRVRKKVEATGAVAPVEKRTGKDGRVRKQPAKKAKAKPKLKQKLSKEAVTERGADVKRMAAATVELVDAHNRLAKEHGAEPVATLVHDTHLAEKLRAAEIKISGLESEVEELKAENAKLREQLEAAQKVAS